jgi:peptide/nickel transport system substrate-binding protein
MRTFFVALASAAAVTALSLATPANAQGTLRVALPSNVNTLDPAKTKIGEE